MLETRLERGGVVDGRPELEERIAYLSAALDASDDAVLSLDLQGRVTSGNRSAQRLLGAGGAGLLGVPFEELVVEHDREVWKRRLELALAGNPHERVELVARRRDGAPVPTQVAVSPVRGPDGGTLGVSLVVRDLAEQLLAQATLADSAQRVAQSEALAHVGSWAWDAASDAVQWSEELYRIHGVSPLEFAGTMAAQLELVHLPDRRAVARALSEALRRGTPFEREFRVVRPDRSMRWVLGRANVVVEPGGSPQGLLGIYHDITERHESALVLQEANERLTRLALYDRLTGLPNRALLVDRLEHRLARRRRVDARVDLLYLGVDDFKTLNDSAGHSVGDQVLTALAPVLGHAVRRVGLPAGAEDPVLARLGGDEFAILVDDSDARELAGSIHEVLRQPLPLPDDQVFISVSIGNTRAGPGREDATPELVLGEAKIAMHEAKRAGKARYVSFEPRMHEAARRRHRLGSELHQALAQEQFVVHYQPVVDLSSGRVTGAEALVRWQHPVRGLVQPGAFIERAEETGVIVPLGAWVLRQACLDARSWLGLPGGSLRVAVNVSGRQLREPDFVDTVRTALEQTALPPQLLCLEMTESILMERDVGALEMLTTLRDEGVHLAIDDFGTGYSSLAALQRLPVDLLKIDRSFVSGLPGDENSATIAWAIVHLGHALSLPVLAEGVETVEQQEELLRFGCDQGQGYLYGRAVPAEEFVDLVQVLAARAPALPRPRGTQVSELPR